MNYFVKINENFHSSILTPATKLISTFEDYTQKYSLLIPCHDCNSRRSGHVLLDLKQFFEIVHLSVTVASSGPFSNRVVKEFITWLVQE